MTSTTRESHPPALTRASPPRPWLTAALAGVFGVAGLIVLLALDGMLTRSSDPGASAVHVGWGWLSAGLLIGICWVSSRRVPWPAVTPGPRIGVDLAVLAACAAAFPLVAALPFWLPEDYVWQKPLLLLLVPALTLWAVHRRTGPAVRWRRPALGAVVVAGALAGIAVDQWLVHYGPGASAFDFSRYDRTTIIVAATATALTASIGEEIFYRYWLQTRLEATLGRWPGILAASIVFGLMHVPSHGAGLGWAAVAVVIANQGVFGIACGYLWSRYRRLWLPILLHLSANGLTVLVHLLTG